MSRFVCTVLFCVMICMQSCKDDGGPRNHEFLFSDIVTIISVSEPSGTRFGMQRYDDSPLIIYTASNWTVPEKYVGQRVHLYYYMVGGEPYNSGEIAVKSVRAINNGSVSAGSVSDPAWDADPVWLNAVWRTGNYLNFRLRLSYSPKPRYFSLVADESTIGLEQPQLYLVHNLDGQSQSYMSETYASFDISHVWNRPSCRSVCVYINDVNYKARTYIFNK